MLPEPPSSTSPTRSRRSTCGPAATRWSAPCRTWAAAWCLAVVDPGVGTPRRGVALEAARRRTRRCTSWARQRVAGGGGGGGGRGARGRAVELRAAAGTGRARADLRRSGRLRAGGSGPVCRHSPWTASASRSTPRPGATDRWGGRDGSPARRTGQPARRGDLGRPVREPAAGGHGVGRPDGWLAARRAPSSWCRWRRERPPRGAPSRPRARRACSCAASTPSPSSATGEFGLLVDANGHLAVVAREASAATLAQRRGRGARRPGLVRVPARSRFGAGARALGTIRRDEHRSRPSPPRRIPEATVLRLPVYQRILAELARDGAATVSSEQLADAGPGQRGQGAQGPVAARLLRHPGPGYDPAFLIAQIDRALGVDEDWSVAIVGIGNLGRALDQLGRASPPGVARSPRSSTSTPAVVGEEIRGMTVRHMDEIAVAAGRRERPDIGVITTPGWAAQQVADLLVRAGVTSLLNFAPRVLDRPARRAPALRGPVDRAAGARLLPGPQRRSGGRRTPEPPSGRRLLRSVGLSAPPDLG